MKARNYRKATPIYVDITIEREISGHTRQNICVGSVSRTSCPKMGKYVRLREREKGRDARPSRGKIFFRRSVKGDGERWSPGQGIDSTKRPLDRRQSKHH